MAHRCYRLSPRFSHMITGTARQPGRQGSRKSQRICPGTVQIIKYINQSHTMVHSVYRYTRVLYVPSTEDAANNLCVSLDLPTNRSVASFAVLSGTRSNESSLGARRTSCRARVRGTNPDTVALLRVGVGQPPDQRQQ